MIAGSTLSPAPCCTALDRYLIATVSDVSSVNWMMLFWMEVEGRGFRTGQTWTGICHYNLVVSKLSPRETFVLILEEDTNMHLSHWPGLNKLPTGQCLGQPLVHCKCSRNQGQHDVGDHGRKDEIYTLYKALEIWAVWGK